MYNHGSPAWAPEFAQWIGDAVPAEVAEERRRWKDWWLDDYVVARLRVRIGVAVMEAILAWRRDGEDYHVVTARLRKSHGWLARQERRATSIVREDYLPYDMQRRLPRAG